MLAWSSVTFGVGMLAVVDLVLVPSYLESSSAQTSVEQVREVIPAATTKIVRTPAPPTRPMQRWVVLFGFGRAELTFASLRKLQEALRVYKTGYETIFIEGHTDTQGNPAYNKVLSRSRAEAVAKWFLDRGVPQDRLKVMGFGGARQVEDGKARTNRESRRVEIILEGS